MAQKIERQIKSILKYPMPDINFSPQIPPLKKIKDKTKIDVRYRLIAPYAYAHIYWDPKEYELFYEIEEPELTAEEKKLKDQIIEALKSLVDFDMIIDKDLSSLLEYIHQRARILAFELEMEISYESYNKIYYYLCRDFVGMNETEPILRDFFVEDIECNGVDTPIYVVHRYYRNIKTNVEFENLAKAENFTEKLAQRCGKHISYSQPILDGSLQDGSRVNATYTKDITSRGPTFTIRKFTQTPWTPPQLISFKTLSLEMMAYLWMLVEHKMNILIAGGTGSGKTTLLNVLAFFIPPEARVVSIEDTRELNLPRENWLPGVSRSATGTGEFGEIDLFTLLKASFRQRPDYIIVGEVRGKEAFVLFQGMASGHPGMATMHAENVNTMVKRLETEPINLSGSLIETLSSVVVMSQTRVKGKEARKVNEIQEIIKVKEGLGGEVLNTVFKWDPRKDVFNFNSNSKVFDNIAIQYGFTKEQVLNEFRIRVKLLKTLYKKRILGFKQVQQIIHEYYKSPETVLQRFNIR